MVWFSCGREAFGVRVTGINMILLLISYSRVAFSGALLELLIVFDSADVLIFNLVFCIICLFDCCFNFICNLGIFIILILILIIKKFRDILNVSNFLIP